MPVEVATFISQLDPSLPEADDPCPEGDDHLRLTKSVLQSQFTSLGAAAVTVTADELNATAGGSAASPFQAQLDVLATLVPIGTICAYGGDTAPTGWLICDGSEVSRTTYAALFAVLGAKYGAGDNTTTFNLPPHEGRAPVGAGSGVGLSTRTVGQVFGAETHLLTANQSGLRAHSHTYQRGDNDDSLRSQNVQGGIRDFNQYETRNTSTVSGQNASQAHNNVQPSIVHNFIVKF